MIHPSAFADALVGDTDDDEPLDGRADVGDDLAAFKVAVPHLSSQLGQRRVRQRSEEGNRAGAGRDFAQGRAVDSA